MIIKHNFRPAATTKNTTVNLEGANNADDELLVEFIDMHDDKENVFGQTNMLKASVNNFAF